MTVIDEDLCAAVTAHPRARRVPSFRYTQFGRNHKHLLAVQFNFTAGDLGLVGPLRPPGKICSSNSFERVPTPGGLILLFTYKFQRLRSSVIIIVEKCLV